MRYLPHAIALYLIGAVTTFVVILNDYDTCYNLRWKYADYRLYSAVFEAGIPSIIWPVMLPTILTIGHNKKADIYCLWTLSKKEHLK